MRKYFAITFAIFTLALASCNEKPDATIKKKIQDEEKSVTATLLGNNAQDVYYHQQNKERAKRYVDDVEQKVKTAEKKWKSAINASPSSENRTSAIVFGKNTIVELNKDKEPFGKIDSDSLGRCTEFGNAAVDYLMQGNMNLASQSAERDMKFYFDLYNEAKKSCIHQINNPPESIVYVLIDDGITPPNKDCQKIMEIHGRKDGKQQWSCPANFNFVK